jgi:hypothetical protein
VYPRLDGSNWSPDGGETMILKGEFFGQPPCGSGNAPCADLQIYLGDQPCLTPTRLSAQFLWCVTPRKPEALAEGVQLDIRLVVGGVTTVLQNLRFSYRGTCPAGSFRTGDACKLCGRNTYRGASDAESECRTCVSDMRNDPLMETIADGAASAGECTCPSSTYERAYGPRRHCFNCNASEVCAANTPLGRVKLVPGYWRLGNGTADTRLCPSARACGGGERVRDYCLDNHAGPYCALCRPGFYLDPNDDCQRCVATALKYPLIVIACLLVAIAVVVGLSRELLASN